jgi:hypothetical protein
MSLQIAIQNRLYDVWTKNREEWTNGGEVERFAMELGYKASNASRRCRELASEGVLDRREINGSVWYRYVPKFQPEEV